MLGGEEPLDSDDRGQEAPGSPESTEPLVFGALLRNVPEDLRNVSFPMAVRGYDRREVDAYVERVNRVIAELEISRSPQSAVKHALDRVGEQTSGVLQRAREVAEELTATALTEAEHATRRAKVEAEETLENARMQAHELRGQAKVDADEIAARAHAEATERLKQADDRIGKLQDDAQRRLRALQAEIDGATEARRKLLDDLRQTATELERFASEMSSRLQPGQSADQLSDPTTQRMPAEAPARPARSAARERAQQGRG